MAVDRFADAGGNCVFAIETVDTMTDTTVETGRETIGMRPPIVGTLCTTSPALSVGLDGEQALQDRYGAPGLHRRPERGGAGGHASLERQPVGRRGRGCPGSRRASGQHSGCDGRKTACDFCFDLPDTNPCGWLPREVPKPFNHGPDIVVLEH